MLTPGDITEIVRLSYGTDSGLYLPLLLLLIQKLGFPVEPHLSGGTAAQFTSTRDKQVVSGPSCDSACCGSTNRSVLLPPRASPSGSQQLYTREYTRRLSGKPIGRNKPKTATQVE